MEKTNEIRGVEVGKPSQVDQEMDQAGNAEMIAMHHQQSVFISLRHFIMHYVEMCLAMCIGGITLNVLFFMGVAQIGYPDLMRKYPEFSILMVGILLAIPMVVWMRIRGHEWRHTLEMASSSIVLAILLIGAAWLSLIPESGMLEGIKILGCPVMLVPMLFRLNHYTASHASHQHHVHASHGGM